MWLSHEFVCSLQPKKSLRMYKSACCKFPLSSFTFVVDWSLFTSMSRILRESKKVEHWLHATQQIINNTVHFSHLWHMFLTLTQKFRSWWSKWNISDIWCLGAFWIEKFQLTVCSLHFVSKLTWKRTWQHT